MGGGLGQRITSGGPTGRPYPQLLLSDLLFACCLGRAAASRLSVVRGAENTWPSVPGRTRCHSPRHGRWSGGSLAWLADSLVRSLVCFANGCLCLPIRPTLWLRLAGATGRFFVGVSGCLRHARLRYLIMTRNSQPPHSRSNKVTCSSPARMARVLSRSSVGIKQVNEAEKHPEQVACGSNHL